MEDAGHNSFTNICDFFEVLLGAGLPPELLESLLGSADEGCASELIRIGMVKVAGRLEPVEEVGTELRGMWHRPVAPGVGHAVSRRRHSVASQGCCSRGRPGGR